MNIAAAELFEVKRSVCGNRRKYTEKYDAFIHCTSKTIKTFFVSKLNRLFVASITTVGNEEIPTNKPQRKKPEIWI